MHQRMSQRGICFLHMKSIHLCLMTVDILENEGYSNI